MGRYCARDMGRSDKRWFAGLLACALMWPAMAHHSGAMFDDKVSVTLAGTVRQFQWTNPHCWIQVLVDEKSGPAEWRVEMGSPSQLFRGGWGTTPGNLRHKSAGACTPTRHATS